jgi:glycine cleavage system H protein
VAVNDAARAAPDLLNQSPEDIGWLFKIRLSNPEELNALMNRTSYQQLVDS